MRIQIIIAICVVVVSPAYAGVTILGSPFDEIIERQSVGMEAACFGPPLPGRRDGFSVAIQPFIGLYGTESILGGIGGALHTTRLVPWDVGLAVGVLDGDFNSWNIMVSTGRDVWNQGRSHLAVEGVLGYQYYIDGPNDHTAITMENSGALYDDDVVIDSFTFLHAMVHVVYTVEVWYFRPVLDLGWTGTRYMLDGYVWDGDFPVTEGPERDESGFRGKASGGVGLAIAIDRGILFGGLKVVGDAGFFQANVGFTF